VLNPRKAKTNPTRGLPSALPPGTAARSLLCPEPSDPIPSQRARLPAAALPRRSGVRCMSVCAVLPCMRVIVVVRVSMRARVRVCISSPAAVASQALPRLRLRLRFTLTLTAACADSPSRCSEGPASSAVRPVCVACCPLRVVRCVLPLSVVRCICRALNVDALTLSVNASAGPSHVNRRSDGR
jgi:hypothetical protein